MYKKSDKGKFDSVVRSKLHHYQWQTLLKGFPDYGSGWLAYSCLLFASQSSFDTVLQPELECWQNMHDPCKLWVQWWCNRILLTLAEAINKLRYAFAGVSERCVSKRTGCAKDVHEIIGTVNLLSNQRPDSFAWFRFTQFVLLRKTNNGQRMYSVFGLLFYVKNCSSTTKVDATQYFRVLK